MTDVLVLGIKSINSLTKVRVELGITPTKLTNSHQILLSALQAFEGI